MTTFVVSFLPTRFIASGFPRIRCVATAKKCVCHYANGAVKARTVDRSNNKVWKHFSIYGFLSFCLKNSGNLPKWLPETDNHHFFFVVSLGIHLNPPDHLLLPPKLQFLPWVRSKCWCCLRGGVGGQLPRNLNWSKSFLLSLMTW